MHGGDVEARVYLLSLGELYTEAADGAMAAMKGRLANKYYALAEEAWAECPEDEEEAAEE